ncbi:MAG: thiamine phosphate synthase [Deltaproteobacteria bacterium HGW-Deltaproteobacteria-11]|nr:MAG: thiamine phosphate synthase [Deltaproteobacteria bacterium HGW-Deltaproteobacteria-11]
MRGLYLVTDRALCGHRTVEEVVLMALRGGAACIQLREKDASTRDFVEEAQRIKAIMAPFRAFLIINDRIDVALAVGADGVHIGQRDMPYEIARKLLGPRAIIGLSVETLEDVERAGALDVDYLGVSPVFETPTKTDTKGRWGLEGLSRIRAATRRPLVAIGGLNASNAADVIRAGADAIAVVSAICAAPDPYQVARELNVIIDDSLALYHR